MGDRKAKILLLVEGAKTDVVLMRHLLDIYGMGDKHEIVSYNTNIYVLYKEMFFEDAPDTLDLLQVLKEHEKDPIKKKVFEERYTDILLVFDLDPQDPQYSPMVIRKMLGYFDESSENGKLYINYPMVESFYHMKNIPDPDYPSYSVTLSELRNKEYKTRVQRENRNHDYLKFARSRSECNQVIIQNIKKSRMITQLPETVQLDPADENRIFDVQADYIKKEDWLYVLCTCVFYIWDYNPGLIMVSV